MYVQIIIKRKNKAKKLRLNEISEKIVFLTRILCL